MPMVKSLNLILVSRVFGGQTTAPLYQHDQNKSKVHFTTPGAGLSLPSENATQAHKSSCSIISLSTPSSSLLS
jgi:hypothetical protein